MRKRIALMNDWLFARYCIDPAIIPDDGKVVQLPHSWNAVDGHDGHDIEKPSKDWSSGDLSGAPDEHYDRGSYWYFHRFEVPDQPLPGGRLYVEVPAAGQRATVYVNGQKLYCHDGGYSCFRADVTEHCHAHDNVLAINVDNTHRSNLYPQHADFTFYGGLYRGVYLISVSSAHFDLDYHGSPGIRIQAKPEGTGAAFELEAWIVGVDENHTVQWSLLDKDDREIAMAVRPYDSPDITLHLPLVRLWSPDEPYLYTVKAQIVRRNEVVDEVCLRTGVRSFACTPQDGFIFNGKLMPLRGVCRHQDRLYKGNALSRKEHWEDARIIKELGANAVRLAHYQHSQDFYDACDEMGLIVWAEIPFITIMNEDPAAHDNCVSQMRELIIQSQHHPCICFWGLSNEVLLGGKLTDTLIENHRKLQQAVRKLDSSRLTTLAHVSNTPEDCALHEITDVEGWNHYMGWYVGTMEDNEVWLDHYHAAYPNRCFAISEYGCEGIITYHSANPKVKDYSEEYQVLYHEHMAKIFHDRPWIWGSFVWNMFDFGVAARNEGGVAGRNNKGLVSMDRKIKKDSYYIYQAYWTQAPMVHICGKRYAQRARDTTQVRIYSNQPVVTLYLNGDRCGSLIADKVFVFEVKLRPGMNTLMAEAGSAYDTAELEKVDLEPAVYTLPSA